LREEEIVRAKRPLELSLVPAIDRAFDGTETIGVMLPDHWNSSCAQLVYKWGPWHEPTILAQRLFAGLRDLDDRGATLIVCPVPGASAGISEAIRDRLTKAAKAK
jgi:L-threonylcarbamoyladenylate synthase